MLSKAIRPNNNSLITAAVS